MGRKSKLELTWQPYSGRQGGRWCKHIDGQRHYFGTAKSKSDQHAYRRALAVYRLEQDIRDRRELTTRLREEIVDSWVQHNTVDVIPLAAGAEGIDWSQLIPPRSDAEKQAQRRRLEETPAIQRSIDAIIDEDDGDKNRIFLDADAEASSRGLFDAAPSSPPTTPAKRWPRSRMHGLSQRSPRQSRLCSSTTHPMGWCWTVTADRAPATSGTYRFRIKPTPYG